MATGRLAGSQSGPSMAIIAIVAIAVILVNCLNRMAYCSCSLNA
jgi:hypothetical protein